MNHAFVLAHHVTTVLRAVRIETQYIKIFELAEPDGWDLPPFTAGAHLDVFLPGGLIRQYSLIGSPRERKTYRIAVQMQAEGRGGSLALHALKIGDIVPVSLPRNLFPLAEAERHVFIAGGIGITPFLPMMDVLRTTGGRFELHYAAAEPMNMAFVEELSASDYAAHVHLYFSRVPGGRRLALSELISSLEPDTHIYACGPALMVDEVLALTASRDEDLVHVERFGPAASCDVAYVVELRRSGVTVPVATGQTMLSAIRGAGVGIDASCEAGVCLQCKTRYLAGTAIHRDLLMSAQERSEFLTPCVSGCSSQSITLDL